MIFPVVSPVIFARDFFPAVPLNTKAPLPVTVHEADSGRWFPYPRGKRNSFSALAKWLDVTPSKFMLPTSHYDKGKADRAVTFIQNLCHTKGKWAGTDRKSVV